MNIVSRIYCRIFQTCFHLALPVLPYRNPQIYYHVADTVNILKDQQITSVLLVTDPGLRNGGSTAALEQLLAENRIHCAIYDGTNANPTVHNVEEARALYLQERCQALIAFGGGSSMDCAKAVGARIVFPRKTVGQLKGLLRVWRKLPLLIAVPTTAGTGRETRELALTAVRLIFDNIEKAYHDGSDRSARENMLQAAHKAGIAFSKSYVGYIHAIAHSLGGQYNIPHGLANSVIMPVVLEEYGEAAEQKLYQLGIASGAATLQDSPQEGARKFIQAIRDLNRSLNIPKTLGGIRKEDIPQMAVHAAAEANPLYPVPRLMNARELEPLYEKIADWRN